MKPERKTDAPKIKYTILAILYIGLFINECSSSKISDLRLCGDKECKTTLSYGRTLAKHMQNDPIFLNFERNVMIEITSKSAGDRPDFWGGRVDGKTGYFPRSFVREYKVENSSPQFIVPTEISDGKIVEMEMKPPPDKAKDDTEVDDEEDQDDTEVEDEEDDIWWENDEDKEQENKAKQQDKEKSAPPSPDSLKDTAKTEQKEGTSRTESQDSDGPKDTAKTEQKEGTSRTQSQDLDTAQTKQREEKVTETPDSDSQHQVGEEKDLGIKTKVEKTDSVLSGEKESTTEKMDSVSNDEKDPIPEKPDPVSIDEKDPTEVEETKEVQDTTEHKMDKEAGSQIHVKKENRVKEKLDELRETLLSFHDIDDKDKVDIEELNKMLEEGAKGKQAESLEDVPSTTSTEKTDSSGTDLEQKQSLKVDDGVKADEKSEEMKVAGLLKETSDDVKALPEDQKTSEKDDTEIADETEVGNGESITDIKQEVVENAGKEVDSQVSGGLAVEPSLTDKDGPPTGQGNTEAGIQPSSVIQDKKEENMLQNSFTVEGSASQSEEKAGSSLSTPGLTEIPSSVTEASTVDSITQQTVMEGFTIIDGTPFPLDMFDDPTPTGDVAKPTESELLSSTSSQQFTSSVSVDELVKSESTVDVTKQTTAQSDIVTKPLEQSPDSSLLPTQTETMMKSLNIDTGSSTDIVPTQTEAVAESSRVNQDSLKVTSESAHSKDSVPEASEQDRDKHTEVHIEEAVKSEDLTDLEKSSLTMDGKVEDVPSEGSEESKEEKDKAKADNTQKNGVEVDQTETKTEENSENVTTVQKEVEGGEQKPSETLTQNNEKPDLSALKFLDDEDTSPDSPSDDENVKEMNVPTEEIKTKEEGKQSQMGDEMTDKPIQEKTTASAVPSTSPVEQLMSSMESEYSVDSKEIIDNTRNTAVVGDHQNATRTVVDTENLKIDLPSTVDAYATADFLSRKPLSHEPHKLQDSVKQEGKAEEAVVAVEAGEENKDAVTQAPPVSTTQKEAEKPSSTDTGNVEDNKQETVTESPFVSTTQPGSSEAEIPPPPTESKDSTTQPSTAQPPGEESKGPEDTSIPESTPDSVTTPDSVMSTQDIQPSLAETAGVTSEASTQGDQADTDSFSQSEFLSRKINDADLEEKEDLAYKAERPWMKSDQFLKWFITKLPPSVQALLEQEPLGLSPQMAILVTMVTLTSLVVVTCCSVICGGGRKSKKQDPVVVVRGLEEKLFIVTKEKENLEDELQVLQQKIQDIEEDSKSTQSSVGDIQKDRQTLQLHNNSLREQVESLTEENTVIQQELSQKTKELRSKDNQLKEAEKQIKQKDDKYNKMNEKLKEANKEIQEKSGEMKTLKSQVHSLTDQVSHLEANKSQLSEEANVWSEKVKELTEQLDDVKEEEKQMAEDLAYKENEIEVLRDCFLQLKAFEDQGVEEGEGEETRDETDSGNIQSKLKSMIDVSQVSAKLRATEEEKRSVENRLDIEMQGRRDMEERILDLERRAENLQSDKMKAERQNSEAQTKLEVLSNYFKQKELELQRELGEQEALKKMNINKLENSDTRTKMMREELDGSKAQIEDLKREILSAERDFRSQIAANEKKAHENWLAARAAERELKESRHEASVLRQKLTDLERRLMQGPPGGLIRPVPSRGMPPPGMINGPPIPGMERPGSRGRMPPGGPRDEDFPGSPGPDSDRRPPPPLGPDDRRIPPFNPEDRRMPFPPDDRRIPPMEGPDRRPTPMGSRVPLPHPMDIRSPPPFDRRPPPPLDRRSPPPYDRGLRFPPPPLDRRSPGQRMSFPPDMPPPHLRGPPRGPLSPPLRNDGIDTPPYRPPPDHDREPRQQSQV
ncbi:transport and Golgi organization protein 1 homolog isoform X2 [Ostrea edulis]|uniref:transport and Golgi organization protein 1 homolog isoform X2 n=1 Tax=Ostrea edulis TaxID=37623 RepID=UPI0024AFE5D0|nr:transport and Golgi organization protein 1 homolog isoform X2 [Ostrea edulis]